ncbi:MAG: AIR synthase related protein, partial [Patescibacteria group bacterium]
MSDSQLNSGTGVDYPSLDAFKRLAQRFAADTTRNARRTGYTGLEWTRGESAFLFQGPDGLIIGHVHEGLGTKNLVADAMGGIYYRNIARDTVAMGVNDLVTLGVLPISVSMHLSVGDATSWFKNSDRAENLIRGWKEACDDAGCVWSCGETPELRGIIYPGSSELSCSVIGSGTIAHVMNPIK